MHGPYTTVYDLLARLINLRLMWALVPQCPVSAIIQEMDSVQKQQKVVSSVADKAQWWEGRRALDTRVEVRGFAFKTSLH